MSAAGRGAHTEREVPEALRTRVHAALAAHGAEAPSADRCLLAGEDLLVAVLGADERSRATALDLLAADALVTLAFELAADRPDSFEALAEGALQRIAARAPDACGRA